jgi:hypothetical protein
MMRRGGQAALDDALVRAPLQILFNLVRRHGCGLKLPGPRILKSHHFISLSAG